MITSPPKDYTGQEKLVENVLKDFGLRFEQQALFSNYIVDFYVPELNIVIEADGIYGHSKKMDIKRDKDLMEIGIEKVLHVKAATKADIYEFLKEELWMLKKRIT